MHLPGASKKAPYKHNPLDYLCKQSVCINAVLTGYGGSLLSAASQDGVEPARRTRRSVGRPKRETFTIAYRVDEATLQWLQERAAPYGMSVHEYARQRLMEAMLEVASEQLRGELREVHADMAALREDLAVSVEILLANITGDPAPTVRAWVNENLRKARQ